MFFKTQSTKLKREGSMGKYQRFMRALGVSAFLCGFGMFAGQPAYADGSVSGWNMGKGAGTQAGWNSFLAVIQRYNASGERFRIDTHCRSACTMFLAIRNVCIDPGATFAFHAGGLYPQGPINPKTSQAMLNHYNAALRQYVSANHFMDTFDFHEISGSDMINRFHYRACS
jgi:hypothetical protein